MKEFIKENKAVVIVLSVVFVLAISLSIWGITSLVSNDDKKSENNNNETNTPVVKGKYDSINDAKDLVDSNDIEKLYNYIIGMGYYQGMETQKYVSELYTEEKVTLEDLSDETIIRTAIKQIVICEGTYDFKNISIDTVKNKIKEIFGVVPTFENVAVKMTSSATYQCNELQCDPEGGHYCSVLPLKNDKKLVSVAADFNDNSLLYLYDEDNEGIMYRHIFKNKEDNYYWMSSEMLGK